MEKNHLFIGLGGTGGKVLRELRKRVYEEFGANEPPSDKANLEYLYVDSSEEDLNDRTGWKVLGKSVHLSDSQKVSIHGIDGYMLNNLSHYPGLQAFLPADDVAQIQSKIGPLIEQGIGGQRRRLGRILMANNLSSHQEGKDFVSRLKHTVNRLTTQSGDSMVTFHICAGLAGGTGSGSIVDVIAQIRKHYPPTAGNVKYKVNLYLYVPEAVVVNQSHDSGFYHANGYAALMELNAISVHRYQPLDVTGEKDVFSGEVNRLLAEVDPFDAAFVYSNINEYGKALDLGRDLPAAVADFLFQHTVASAMVGSNGQMSRLIGCENDGAGAENDQAGQATRSRKFLSFGIKRVEYPENEIKEYATYKFAMQTARQFTFNKWDSSQGYIELTEEEVGLGFASEIKERKNREKLKLSNQYLMLSKPIEERQDTKRWKEIAETWEERTNQFADDVMAEEEKRSWLNSFSERCKDYYDNQFRAHGVKRFYEVQRQERIGYARFIRRHIEKLLFDEWVAGSKSVLEVCKFLSLLISDCRERMDDFKRQTAQVEEDCGAIQMQIQEIHTKWSKISWTLDPISGSSKAALAAYKDAKRDLYVAHTRIEGFRYATELLQDIIRELGLAQQGAEEFKRILNEILEEVGKQAESRCQTQEADSQVRTLKKYDPETVRQLVKSYITQEEMQRDNALAIRNEMVKALGEEGERSFANLCDKSDYQSTVSLMLNLCSGKAEAAMENSAKADILYKMVRVNILEKLKMELNSEEKREAFVKKLVASAGNFIQFNPTEQAKSSIGNGGVMQSMVQLCIPRFEEDTTGFRDALIRAFEMACPGFNPKTDVAENYKENQLVVVTARSGFPLRYLSNLTVLKQKYDLKLADADGKINRVLLHSETFDPAHELPSLYEMDSKELKSKLVKPVLLAYAMGLVQSATDPTTEEVFDAINLPDPELALMGMDNLVPLGKNILDTIELLSQDYDKAKRVMEQVESKRADYRSNTQKAALRKELGCALKKILACPACENNPFNPLYQKYQKIAVELAKTELADR